MLDKLEYLMALARERHFGRAAEACGVTQPTLSAGVKQLEEQMGVLLVNRGSRFQGFTPEGQRVLDWARRIVGDSRAMREEINALRHGLSGQLRIAAIPTALAMVAALTTPYRERHPNVRFTIYSRTSIEILELLDNLEIDAGITLAQRPVRTCENNRIIESDSSVGRDSPPAPCSRRSMMRRFCMSGVSRHSGTCATSAQVTRSRLPSGASAAVSS